jgi:D-serine deaminase-like pyridoxal phosphate-dependent protein
MREPWFQVSDLDRIPSPALLVYPQRVEENIRCLIKMAGSPDRLRPHVKTHKMPELIRRQLRHGITKFKCSTIAELEMCAVAGARDVLLAYQPVGPNIARLRELCDKFPEVRFGALVDTPEIVTDLEGAFLDAPKRLAVYLDLDCGMHRTGIDPGGRAMDLYRRIEQSAVLAIGGLHAYDGHNHEQDLDQRTMKCEMDFQIIRALSEELREEGVEVPEIVAGGSPTLPIHLQHGEITCSPGTVFLWDYGYGMGLPDLDFQVAAVVLCRVISRPSRNRVCVDLGHKAVAAENPHPRVRFLNLLDGEAVMQSEEHLVLESLNAEYARVGDALYGVPRHICPTVALYDRAYTIEDGRLSGEWEISARDRRLTV